MKRCCEQTISSLPDAELRSASDGKRQIPTLRKRQRRATVRDEHHGVPGVSGTDEGRVSTSTIVSETGTNGADDARRPAAGPKQQFGVNASEAVERRPESPDLSSKDGTERRTASVRRRVKDGGDDGEITDDDEVVGVKEREVEKHGHTHLAKSGDSLARNQPNPRQSDPSGCDGCKEGERCDCVKGSGTTGESNGLPRTRRTDEAVWAAAALGFLLVLLALSVLHTRLYRHWRAPPSLYWHDPQQDYDSVAGGWTRTTGCEQTKCQAHVSSHFSGIQPPRCVVTRTCVPQTSSAGGCGMQRQGEREAEDRSASSCPAPPARRNFCRKTGNIRTTSGTCQRKQAGAVDRDRLKGDNAA